MLQSIKGIYRNGKVELLESPKEVRQAQVIVTFLDAEITTHGEEAKPGKSLVNSGEILTDDLTRASAEIAAAKQELSEEEKQRREANLARHFGAITSGDPRSADNDKIDADLARAYDNDF